VAGTAPATVVLLHTLLHLAAADVSHETELRMVSPPKSQSYVAAGATGALAGTVACIVQTLVGATLNAVLLPRGHDNNIAPRLVHQSARKAGHHTSPAVDWLLGTLFHVGYGIGWGGIFGVVRRWSNWPSLLLGSALGGLLYLLEFTSFGVGPQTGTEQPPEQRPWQKQVSLVSVVLTYALCLAIVFDRLTHFRRTPTDRAT
jgi:hypothetical protein